MEKLSEYITLHKAAELTGYNQDYLSYLVRNGKIKGQKIGKSWVTTEKEISNYFDQDSSFLAVFFRLPKVIQAGIEFIILSIALAVVFIVFYFVVYNLGYSRALEHNGPVKVSTQLDDTSQN